MKIYGYGELSDAPSDSVVALGFFDGVHSAHRKLISEAREKAVSVGKKLGILTFSSESEIKRGSSRLYSSEQRLKIFEEIGADFAVVLDFAEICDLSPREFVEAILVRGLRISVAYAGYNFRFGKSAAADAQELSRLMAEYGKTAVICDEITMNGQTVSATLIRALIESGDIQKANMLLGTPYFISGEVIRGNGKGHTLGFPTVNMSLPKGKSKPKNGVYRSLVRLDKSIYNAVTNIGTCPTFNEREIHAETFIIDFSGDVYGESITVYLLGYLREEKEFESPEMLKMQIEVDKNTTLQKNGEEKWQELGLK